jgi:hypothetical protein
VRGPGAKTLLRVDVARERAACTRERTSADMARSHRIRAWKCAAHGAGPDRRGREPVAAPGSAFFRSTEALRGSDARARTASDVARVSSERARRYGVMEAYFAEMNALYRERDADAKVARAATRYRRAVERATLQEEHDDTRHSSHGKREPGSASRYALAPTSPSTDGPWKDARTRSEEEQARRRLAGAREVLPERGSVCAAEAQGRATIVATAKDMARRAIRSEEQRLRRRLDGARLDLARQECLLLKDAVAAEELHDREELARHETRLIYKASTDHAQRSDHEANEARGRQTIAQWEHGAWARIRALAPVTADIRWATGITAAAGDDQLPIGETFQFLGTRVNATGDDQLPRERDGPGPPRFLPPSAAEALDDGATRETRSTSARPSRTAGETRCDNTISTSWFSPSSQPPRQGTSCSARSAAMAETGLNGLGVGFAVRVGPEAPEVLAVEYRHDRLAVMKVRHGRTTVHFVAVQEATPAAEQDAFWELLKQLLSELDGCYVLLGDFNATLPRSHAPAQEAVRQRDPPEIPRPRLQPHRLQLQGTADAATPMHVAVQRSRLALRRGAADPGLRTHAAGTRGSVAVTDVQAVWPHLDGADHRLLRARFGPVFGLSRTRHHQGAIVGPPRHRRDLYRRTAWSSSSKRSWPRRRPRRRTSCRRSASADRG